MDCSLITGELVGYELGALEDETRDAVEAHLLGCGACLRAYLGVKRAMDRAGGERPRDAVKKRLRDEVARTYRPGAGARARRLLARPVPLYQAFAAAALIVLGASWIFSARGGDGDADAPREPVAVTTAPPSPRAAPPSRVTRVDSAREQPESLAFY